MTQTHRIDPKTYNWTIAKRKKFHYHCICWFPVEYTHHYCANCGAKLDWVLVNTALARETIAERKQQRDHNTHEG